MQANINKTHILPPDKRKLYGGLVLLTGMLFIVSAGVLPFIFKSSSILYKFGLGKQFLLGGKILGLVAACLILFQAILSARLKIQDRIFGLDHLMQFHRISGICISFFALLHPLLILRSEDMWMIPFELRYWPEFTGLFLSVSILVMVAAANFRSAIGIPFHWWRVLHQWGAVVVAAALFTHVLFVSETFAQGLPRYVVIFILAGYVLLFCRVRLMRFGLGRHPFKVVSVQPAGKDACSIQLKPVGGKIFDYAPGQFGFFQFKSSHLSREEHPFTLASSPSRPDLVEIAVRRCGDWTNRISDIQPGDICRVDGPYGLFSHLMHDASSDMIMIAGGIGITPMLSMLRYAADTRNAVMDTSKIILIWSNQTHDHIVFPKVFEVLKSRLKGLKIIHLFTRQPGVKGQRLDADRLSHLLSNANPFSYIYVCGPPKMMKDMKSFLKKQGFAKSHIFMERFSL